MTKAILILQFSVLIPLLVGLVFYRKQDKFLRFIYFSLLASLFGDIIATVSAFVYGINSIVFYLFFIVHSILITLAWYNIDTYNNKHRSFVKFIGVAFIIALFVTLIFRDQIDHIVSSSINVLLMVIYGLQYYYTKLFDDKGVGSFLEHKFIIASSFLLFSFSVLIIYSTYLIFTKFDFTPVWLVKQVIYTFFNLIIAYSFYLYKSRI